MPQPADTKGGDAPRQRGSTSRVSSGAPTQRRKGGRARAFRGKPDGSRHADPFDPSFYFFLLKSLAAGIAISYPGTEARRTQRHRSFLQPPPTLSVTDSSSVCRDLRLVKVRIFIDTSTLQVQALQPVGAADCAIILASSLDLTSFTHAVHFSLSGAEAKRKLLDGIMTVEEVCVHAQAFERHSRQLLDQYNELDGIVKWSLDANGLPVPGSLPAKLFYNILALLGMRVTKQRRIDKRLSKKLRFLKNILAKLNLKLPNLCSFEALQVSPETVNGLYHQTSILNSVEVSVLRLFILHLVRSKPPFHPLEHAEQVINPFMPGVRRVLQRIIKRREKSQSTSNGNLASLIEEEVDDLYLLFTSNLE